MPKKIIIMSATLNPIFIQKIGQLIESFGLSHKHVNAEAAVHKFSTRTLFVILVKARM